ncbi:MAG TPA: hypothetical protein VGJ32_17415 [Solirubrobacteraceae bacterium]
MPVEVVALIGPLSNVRARALGLPTTGSAHGDLYEQPLDAFRSLDRRPPPPPLRLRDVGQEPGADCRRRALSAELAFQSGEATLQGRTQLERHGELILGGLALLLGKRPATIGLDEGTRHRGDGVPKALDVLAQLVDLARDGPRDLKHSGGHGCSGQTDEPPCGQLISTSRGVKRRVYSCRVSTLADAALTADSPAEHPSRGAGLPSTSAKSRRELWSCCSCSSS